jgi:hypothetical protein
MPYSAEQLPAKVAGGATQTLTAVSGPGIPVGTIAPVRVDPGIGPLDSQPITAAAVLATPDIQAALLRLAKGMLITLGDRGDPDTATSIVGLLVKIAANTAGGGGGGGGTFSSAGIGDPADLPTSLTTLTATPATASPLVALGKALLINIGASTGAVVTPATIAAATTTAYSLGFMVRILVGSAGQIALAVGAANDTTAPAIGDGSIVALLKRIRDNTASGGGGGGGGSSVDGAQTDAPADSSLLIATPATAMGTIALLKALVLHLGRADDATTQGVSANGSVASLLKGVRSWLSDINTATGTPSDTAASLSLLSMMPSTATSGIALLKAIGLILDANIQTMRSSIGLGSDSASSLTTTSSFSTESIIGLLKSMTVSLRKLDTYLRVAGNVSRRANHTIIPFAAGGNTIFSTASSHSASDNNEAYLLSIDCVNKSSSELYVWVFGATSSSSRTPFTNTNQPPSGAGLFSPANGELQVITGPWIVPANSFNLVLGEPSFGTTGITFYGPAFICLSTTFTTYTPFASTATYARARWIRRDTSI